MKLKTTGKILKNGKVVGDYGYSFLSCSFNFQIGNVVHHFWKKEELEKYLVENGYSIS